MTVRLSAPRLAGPLGVLPPHQPLVVAVADAGEVVRDVLAGKERPAHVPQ